MEVQGRSSPPRPPPGSRCRLAATRNAAITCAASPNLTPRSGGVITRRWQACSERCPMRRRPWRVKSRSVSYPSGGDNDPCDTCWRPGFTGANKRQRTFAEVGLKVDVSAFKGDTSPSGASSRSAEQSGCHRNPLRSTAESDVRACGPSDSHFQFQNDEVTRRSSG